MDARQLRYFLAIVEAGGVTKAADHLLIAQPSLSQALHALESELGVPLFHRVGRRLVLTPAGEDLVAPARLVVRDLDAAKSAMDAHRGVHTGRLDLITMPSPGLSPLVEIIAAFTAAHPDVRLNVGAAFTPEEVLDAVRSGASEIGLAGSREELRGQDLNVVDLAAQPLMLVVAKGARAFRGRTSIAREDLSGEPLVVSQQGSLMRWLVDDLVSSGVPARVVVEVAHRTSILPLVLAGVGHAVLPAAWQPLAARLGLKVCAIEPASLLRISLVARANRLTPVAEVFLSEARAAYRAAPGHT